MLLKRQIKTCFIKNLCFSSVADNACFINGLKHATLIISLLSVYAYFNRALALLEIPTRVQNATIRLL